MEDKKMVYLIVMTENTSINEVDLDNVQDIPSMDPVAVYSSLEKAERWAKELQEMSDKREGEDTYFFDVIEYEIDSEPLLLTFMKAEGDELEDYLTQSIQSLMASGIIDQLIGEDGHFHYVLTERGKEVMGDVSQDVIKKFLNVEDDESPDGEAL